MTTFMIDNNHEPSLLPDGKNWSLVWHDEFDGKELDSEKWDVRLYMMGKRHSTWVEDAYELDGNSNLLLKLVEKDGHYYTTQLQTGENYMDRPGNPYTSVENDQSVSKKFEWPIAPIKKPKFMHRYGYYEIRCKLQKNDGWWSAFWLQSPCIGSTLDPARSGVEVDIMECFSHTEGKVESTLHWNGYGAGHKSQAIEKIKLRDIDDYHRFGVEWREDGYIFYLDGKETGRLNDAVSKIEQFLLISTEAWGYRKGDQPLDLLRDAVLPDCFAVDYVRIFDEVK